MYIYIYTRAVPHISMCGLPVVALLALAFVGSMHLLLTTFVSVFVFTFVSAFDSPFAAGLGSSVRSTSTSTPIRLDLAFLESTRPAVCLDFTLLDLTGLG